MLPDLENNTKDYVENFLIFDTSNRKTIRFKIISSEGLCNRAIVIKIFKPSASRGILKRRPNARKYITEIHGTNIIIQTPTYK